MREAVAVSKAVGVTTLDGLTDVTITSAATGDVLRYNGTAWVDAVLAIADTSGLQTALDAKLGGSLGSTDNRVLRADGTGGSTAQGSAVTIDDSGNVTGVAALTAIGTVTAQNIAFAGGNTANLESGSANRIFLRDSSTIQMILAPQATQVLQVRGDRGIGWSDAGFSINPDVTLSRASANTLQIGTTGLSALGSLNLSNLTAGGTVTAGGNIVFGTDGTADIGRAFGGSTNRPRDISASRWMMALQVVVGASNNIWMSASSTPTETLELKTVSDTPISGLRFGMPASANPLLKRNGNGFDIRNGNDTAFTDLAVNNLTASGLIGLGTYTVATLPSASANAGRIAQVTDSSVTANGSAVSGGGSNRVMVFSNGTNWDVVVA